MWSMVKRQRPDTAIVEPEVRNRNIRKHVKGAEYNVYNRVNGVTKGNISLATLEVS